MIKASLRGILMWSMLANPSNKIKTLLLHWSNRLYSLKNLCLKIYAKVGLLKL